MLISNLDRTDAQLNTKAPFQFQCALKFKDLELPSCSILSIRLYLDTDMTLPCRLSKLEISAGGEYADAYFVDGKGSLIGTWRIKYTTSHASDYVSAFIYDDVGIITGHITCSSSLPPMLFSVCRAYGGSIITDTNDFKLLPQCCIPAYKGKGKSIIIGDNATTADVTINMSPKLRCTRDAGLNIRVDALGDFICETMIISGSTVRLGKNKITTLKVNNKTYDVGGKHLVVKAGVTSNLRISNKLSNTQSDTKSASGGLVFSGVTDE